MKKKNEKLKEKEKNNKKINRNEYALGEGEKEKMKKNKKVTYITCKCDPDLRRRIKKIADMEKRSLSNLINFIVEDWLNENEVR